MAYMPYRPLSIRERFYAVEMSRHSEKCQEASQNDVSLKGGIYKGVWCAQRF